VLAANAPDSDVLVVIFGDRWDYLQNHRGITHSIAGVVFLAILLPLIFYGVDRLRSLVHRQPPKTNLRGLLIASFIASATHPLLDWTNNYGIRLLLPWNPRWFYGDLVFIVDPFLWVVLGSAAFLLASKTPVSKVIWSAFAGVITFLLVLGPRSSDLPNRIVIIALWLGALVATIALYRNGAREKWGERIAFVAFAVVLAYWGTLAFAHSRAVTQGREKAARIVAPSGETVLRLAAMPTLANPLSWDCVFETDRATYRFPVHLNAANASPRVIRYEKPSGVLAQVMNTVEQRKPARVFLGFARFPVARLADPDCATQTFIQLADLRYTEPGRSRGTFAVDLPVDCPNEPGGRKTVTGGR
jgi:inner membrane protein